LNLIKIQGRGAFFGHNDQVFGRKPIFMAPEKFPEQAPDPVAFDRFAETFGYHQSQAGASLRAWGQGDAEMPGMQPSPLGHGPEKIGPVQKAIRLGETGGTG